MITNIKYCISYYEALKPTKREPTQIKDRELQKLLKITHFSRVFLKTFLNKRDDHKLKKYKAIFSTQVLRRTYGIYNN